jgi:hypothetical protein
MTVRIRKGYPIQLPPYRWGGEAATWAGKIISAANKDLPIAYLRAHLQELGLSLHYVSPNAAGAGAPLCVPCVLFGGEPSLISSLEGELKQRADRLGLIHASSLIPPFRGGGSYAADMLYGVPVQYAEMDAEALDPPTYLGGRVLTLVNGAFVGGGYLDTEGVFDFEYAAQPGSQAVCESLDPTFSAGTEAVLTSSPTSLAIDLVNNGPIGDRIADDGELLERAARRFDKFQIWFETNGEAGPAVYRVRVSCFEGSIGENVAVDTDEEGQVSTVAYTTNANAAADQVISGMGGYGARVAWPPSVETILAYFESP